MAELIEEGVVPPPREGAGAVEALDRMWIMRAEAVLLPGARNIASLSADTSSSRTPRPSPEICGQQMLKICCETNLYYLLQNKNELKSCLLLMGEL